MLAPFIGSGTRQDDSACTALSVKTWVASGRLQVALNQLEVAEGFHEHRVHVLRFAGEWVQEVLLITIQVAVNFER